MENMFSKDGLTSIPDENYLLEGPPETTKEMQDELMHIVEEYYKDHEVSEDLTKQFMIHNRQVRDYVERFSAEEEFGDKEKEIATLAAILHDITKGWGNFLKHGKEGGEIAEGILLDMGISKELAKSVRLAIERHMGPDGYPTRKAKEKYGEDFEYPKYQTKVGQIVFECDILTQLTPEGFAKILLLREKDKNNFAEDAKRAAEEDMTIEKARFLSVLESARKSLELIATPSVKREAEELWKKIEEEYGKIKSPIDSSDDISDKVDEKDVERTNKLLNMEYVSIEKYAELVDVFRIAQEKSNHLRKKLKLEEIKFNISDLRLIDVEKYKQIEPEYEGDRKEEDKIKYPAFYSSDARLCFFEFNQNEYETSRSYRVEMQHRIIHEFLHMSSDGKAIYEYAAGLNEGIIENEAIEITENEILSKIFTETDYEVREDFADNFGYYVSDILIWNEADNEHARLYPYMFQTDFARKIKKEDPDVYDDLLKCILENDPKRAEDVLKKAYGSEIAEAISNRSTVRFTEIMEMIDLYKKNN